MTEMPGEKCAVVGVYGPDLDAARLSFFGLFALQHRGQESSGIAVSDGETIHCHKGMGLVAHVYDEDIIATLPGHIGIGHNRYSTTGGSKLEHAQPILVDGGPLGTIALAHNGNLPSTTALVEFLAARNLPTEGSDSKLMAEAVAAFARDGKSLADAVREAFPLFTGAFSVLVMDTHTLVAVRDQCGIRPLSLASLGRGFVVASETCAFHTAGAQYLRDIDPGEMVVIDAKGMHSELLAPANLKLDIFELVYFARPDSELFGRSIYSVRKQLGAQLAREYPLDIDVVIPVPDTAMPVALGYSQERGVPFEMGLAKNRYIHRTFIAPDQHVREQGVKRKLSPIPEVIRGKRVGVIDDSIVRGTTSKQIVRMLFEAGAAEVHFLVSSPPVVFPDFYGIDTSEQSKLIAATKTVPEIRDFLGATSLSYLSYHGMIAATGQPESVFCTSCFTGEYPIDIKERAQEIVIKKCLTPLS
jgi:amidophosphoribosyltransferase